MKTVKIATSDGSFVTAQMARVLEPMPRYSPETITVEDCFHRMALADNVRSRVVWGLRYTRALKARRAAAMN